MVLAFLPAFEANPTVVFNADVREGIDGRDP
jgi:hypothetical protein